MKRRALLIFAEPSHTDCKRRGWSSAFRILLETHSFSFEQDSGFDVHLFTSRGFNRLVSSSSHVHYQEGVSFGQRLENAIESLVRIGYQEIVIVGQDCPDLEPVDVRRAFDLLGTHRLVLGPDHRGGCYLIGIHATDGARLKGVQWQQNTDFRQIWRRFANESAIELPVKIDLDTLEDVWLLAGSKSPFRWVARALLDSCTDHVTFENSAIQPQFEEERIHWQLPPPAAL
jgi:hypothetical protein